MGELYDRKYRIIVRDLLVSSLRCMFKVTRSMKPEPNQAELKIYNLSPTQRQSLESLPDRPAGVTLKAVATAPRAHNVVLIDAGYVGGTSQIYLGEVRDAISVTEGTDIVTTVSTGDGEKEIQKSRIHVPVGPATPISVALSAIVKALGCGEGNLATMLPQLTLNGAAQMHVKGTVLSGSAADELDAFCRSANLEWSIQNGKLQLVNRGKALAGTALLLSSDTGLIESPTVDSNGIVTFKTLMIPDMYPGRLVVFASKNLKGGYRLMECTYQGDTHGKEWDISCKAERIAL